MEKLLEKTRKLNKLLQGTAGSPVNFDEIAGALSSVISANVYIVSRLGKVLGYALMEGFTCEVIEEIVAETERFPEDYNSYLLKFEETASNLEQEESACVFNSAKKCAMCGKLTTVVPIIGGGQRLGTLVLARFKDPFSAEDLILAEYGATAVGMEILRSKAERVEEEARKRAAVHVALGTLSYSELEAAEQIFAELEGNEGILVASKVADRAGITRSVIVNALRKFESAGVIESKSLGMKGTYIRVLNDYLIPELQRLRHRVVAEA